MYNVKNNNSNNLNIQTRRLSKSEGISKSVNIFEYHSNIIECSLHLGNNVAFADILTRQSNFRSSLTTLITRLFFPILAYNDTFRVSCLLLLLLLLPPLLSSLLV